MHAAAMATALVWGHQLRYLSTHFGDGSFFNQGLVIPAATGKKPYALHTVTIEDALAQGLLARIRPGSPDTAEARAAFLAELRAGCATEEQYLEEFMCVPSSEQSALLTYDAIQACELAGLVPVADVGLPGSSSTGGGAVDGEATSAMEIDEQGRQVWNFQCDLVVGGTPADAVNLYETVRGMATPGGEQFVGGSGTPLIIREGYEISEIQEVRLRAHFQVVWSVDGSPLISWRQSFKFVGPPDNSDGNEVYHEVVYPGAAPVLVRDPVRNRRLVQSGSAVCLGGPMAPPAASGGNFLEPPEVSFAMLDLEQYQTDWSYTLAVGYGYVAGGGSTTQDVALALARVAPNLITDWPGAWLQSPVSS
jgi:hypothetical protein